MLYTVVGRNIFAVEMIDAHPVSPFNPGITPHYADGDRPASRDYKMEVCARAQIHFIEDYNMNRALATHLLGLLFAQERKGFKDKYPQLHAHNAMHHRLPVLLAYIRRHRRRTHVTESDINEETTESSNDGVQDAHPLN